MAGTDRQRGLIRQWRIVRALEMAQHGLTWAQLQRVAQDDATVRTIRRDIDTLTLAGFPIDVVSGLRGHGSAEAPTKVYWQRSVN